MKLLLLRCPQCNHALAPAQDAQVVQCPNCRSAVAINEGGLSLLAVLYAVASREDPPYWLPFWVYRGQVTIQERQTQGGRSAEKDAQAFWAGPRQVLIPAWDADLLQARDMISDLIHQQPTLKVLTNPEGLSFEPAVITREDGRKLLELVIVTIEAERKDYMELLSYDLRLDSEVLWLLPAERMGDDWNLLLKKP